MNDECKCWMRDREPNESMRAWFKDMMCMKHWMQTDYYQVKLNLENAILTNELLDLITIMPAGQTKELTDYIKELDIVRARQHVDTKTNI